MDKSTFEIKVLGCEKTLYHVAKSILSNDSDCEDAVQEALLKAYKNIEKRAILQHMASQNTHK